MDDFEKAEILLEDAESLRDMDLKLSLEMLKEAHSMAPDYPNLANKIFLLESSLEEMNNSRDRLLKMSAEGEYYKALELLNSLPLGYIFDEKDEVSKRIKDHLHQTEDLVSGASAVSQHDLFQRLNSLKRALEITPDFPGIREKMRVIELKIAQFKESIDEIKTTIDTGDTEEAQELLDSLEDQYLKTGTLYELQQRITNRIMRKKRILALVLFLVFSLSFIITYGTYELRSISKARSAWEEVETMISEGKFEEAQESSKAILPALTGNRLLWQNAKKELAQQVNDLLNSESFQEGLKGNILFEGRYIPKAAALKTGNMNQLVSAADHFRKTERFEEAIKGYQHALKVTSDIKSEESAAAIATIKSLIEKTKLAR